jgi:hypothetical protein
MIWIVAFVFIIYVIGIGLYFSSFTEIGLFFLYEIILLAFGYGVVMGTFHMYDTWLMFVR